MSSSIRCEVGGVGFTIDHRAIIQAFLKMLIGGLIQKERSRILVVDK